MASAHVAADTVDSRLAAWVPSPGSADADVYNEKTIMTARARDLVRNYPVAAGARRTLIDNVIGSQLKLSSRPAYRPLGQDKDWAHEWGNAWEDEFDTWANTSECDIARSQNFLGLTRQALSGAYVNGDHFAIVQWDKRPYTRWSTRLQLVEADRVATPPWLQHRKDIRDGVEVDGFGAPVAYHIAKQHPGDLALNLGSSVQTEWVRVPAFTSWGRRRVIHLFDKERSGQTRGKTVFATVIRELKVGWDYLSSELQAAASNALIAAFLESDLSQEEVARLFGADAETATGYWKEIGEKWNRKRMEGGMFMQLPAGAKLNSFDSNRPNTSFDPFMETITRYIGIGLGMPFELIGKNFSKTNYSSARAALAEAWRFFLAERTWLEATWLSPILECVMEEAVDKSRIIAPDYYDNKYPYTAGRWIYSGRGVIDPKKEADASTIRLQNRTATLEDLCAEQGQDWEDVLEQQKREEMKCEELEITSPYQAELPAPGTIATDPSQNVEETDPEDTTDA